MLFNVLAELAKYSVWTTKGKVILNLIASDKFLIHFWLHKSCQVIVSCGKKQTKRSIKQSDSQCIISSHGYIFMCIKSSLDLKKKKKKSKTTIFWLLFLIDTLTPVCGLMTADFCVCHTINELHSTVHDVSSTGKDSQVLNITALKKKKKTSDFHLAAVQV